MAQFSYDDYMRAAGNAAQGQAANTQQQKIGFFKLANGQEALVRFNLRSVNDLIFATIHKPVFGAKYDGLPNPYAGISCFNSIGGTADNCPLCQAVAAGNPIVDKAVKKVFVLMLVSYKDAQTGVWGKAVPMVWERPAGFAREIATKIQNYGDLTQSMFIMTRIGAGTDTRYSLDYAPPAVFKDDLIPADFSAFNGFEPSRHLYYEKSAEELMKFLATGKFEAQQTQATAPQAVAPQAAAPIQTPTPVTVAPAANTVVVDPVLQRAQEALLRNQAAAAPIQPAQPTVSDEPTFDVETAQPAAQPIAQPQPVQPAVENTPARNFTGFSF